MEVDIDIDEGALSESEDFDGALHALAKLRTPSEQADLHSDTDGEDFAAALHASIDSPSGELSIGAALLPRHNAEATNFSTYFSNLRGGCDA